MKPMPTLIRSAVPALALALTLVSVAGCASTTTSHNTTARASAQPNFSTLEKFMKIRTPGAATLAPDGTLYVRDNPDGIFQLYRVEGEKGKQVAGDPTKMTKLTNYTDGLSGYTVSPDGKTILLLHAFGGNENTQISLFNGTANSTTPLAENPKVQHAINAWLDDSSGFVYTANDESPSDFYIYRYDLATKKKTKLLGKAGSWSASDVSEKADKLLVDEFKSASDSAIYELDVASGNLTAMSPQPAGKTANNGVVGYLPGEKGILLTSDFGGDSVQLYLRDSNGKLSEPIAEIKGKEVDGAAINQERTLLAVSTNEDGYGVMHLYKLPSFEKVELPPIEKGIASFSSIRGNQVSWTLTNARTPGLAYVWTVGEPFNTVRLITTCDTQGIDLASFTLPELIKYKSFDGTMIPAFVYVPSNFKKGSPIPFVVNYHGGPEGQHRPSFDRTTQYLLSEGFGVIQPNVRGSSGYGRAFQMMDDYKKRWDSVRDGVDAAQWLVDNGYATPGKISTYGGSYGGFMSVACIVEDQERVDAGKQKQRLFGGGINVVGIVNVKTFLEQTSGYRRKLREAEYGPLSDPEFLASVSSIHRIDKINVPMMIAHGLNDPRVPVGEAMQLAIGLKQKGMTPVEFYAPDEGHGFAKLSNRLLFTKEMAKFLKTNIGN